MKLGLPRLLLLLPALLGGQPQALAFDKADLAKAAIIEKIAGFIQWPKPRGADFKICVTADHPLLDALRSYFAQTPVAGQPASVATIKLDAAPADCRVFYLDAPQLSQLPHLLTWSARNNVLLVADTPDAAAQGVHVAFFASMNHLQIEVNRKSMEASGLQPSFKLLQVVKIVE